MLPTLSYSGPAFYVFLFFTSIPFAAFFSFGCDPLFARGKPSPRPVGREGCRVPGFTDRKLSWNSRQVSKLPGMVHKIYQMYSHSHGEDRSITI